MRLFFALWPDDGARHALAAAARRMLPQCGGRATPECNLHMTLAFLGAVQRERLDDLHALAASLRLPGFALALDRSGWWPRQRLVWAAPGAVPPGLLNLASQLAGRLRESGFGVERGAFKPHVTLLRDAQGPPPGAATGAAGWSVSDFVLASSEAAPRGVRYRIVGRWPLAGGL